MSAQHSKPVERPAWRHAIIWTALLTIGFALVFLAGRYHLALWVQHVLNHANSVGG